MATNETWSLFWNRNLPPSTGVNDRGLFVQVFINPLHATTDRRYADFRFFREALDRGQMKYRDRRIENWGFCFLYGRMTPTRGQKKDCIMMTFVNLLLAFTIHSLKGRIWKGWNSPEWSQHKIGLLFSPPWSHGSRTTCGNRPVLVTWRPRGAEVSRPVECGQSYGFVALTRRTICLIETLVLRELLICRNPLNRLLS